MHGADVRIMHGGSLAGRDAQPVHAGDVDRRLGAAHRVDDGGRSRQVALTQIDPQRGQRLGLVEVAYYGSDAVTAAHQPADDRLADEPGTAGDEDAHQGARPGRMDGTRRLSRSGCPGRPTRARP